MEGRTAALTESLRSDRSRRRRRRRGRRWVRQLRCWAAEGWIVVPDELDPRNIDLGHDLLCSSAVILFDLSAKWG